MRDNNLTLNEQHALNAIARDAIGHYDYGKPLGGLTLDEFRAARARLVAAGWVVKDTRGRYRLVASA